MFHQRLFFLFLPLQHFGVFSVTSLNCTVLDCSSRHAESNFLLCVCLCADCEEYYFLHEGQCVRDCPNMFFQHKEQRNCLHCHPDCALCDGPKSDDCEACTDPKATLHNGECLGACPSNSYRDEITGECEGSLPYKTWSTSDTTWPLCMFSMRFPTPPTLGQIKIATFFRQLTGTVAVKPWEGNSPE